VRRHLILISHLGCIFTDEKSLSQYFIAPESRSNGHPARMLNHYVVRLYKKGTLHGYVFVWIPVTQFVL
jgi:hypothetical protein